MSNDNQTDGITIKIASPESPIAMKDLMVLAHSTFNTFVKFVADIQNDLIAFGGELHADAEAVLLEKGSEQSQLWGGNFFFDSATIEYTSLINIRSSDHNPAMEVLDPDIREKIGFLIKKVIR